MNSILGALVGDAAGATLEFCDGQITEEMALNAMTMPGGGALCVGPGQITDDGELTLTLWQSLNSFDTSDIIPILTLMKGYAKWYESCPFDTGRTCSLAFGAYYDFFRGCIQTFQNCKLIVYNLNEMSEANGALMRASAIATWVFMNPSITIDMAVECAKEDARLSHPSIICQEVNAIYVFAIVYLLRGKTPEEVISLLNIFVKEQITTQKVHQWYFVESLDISNMITKPHIGHLRWGFVMGMYFLRNSDIGYEDAIKITLMKGGDTDTNAAIVGGLVGAYHKIPDYMLKPVLTFDCTASGKYPKRPAEYSVKNVIGHLI
jgi:ADP-ribosylglycohydrolase